jgi:DNA repair protein RecO (recombination protein O)
MAGAMDQAVCVRHWEWSETSQTVLLLTRAHGLVRALAKGSRRPGANYSGGLELLTMGQAGLIIKPSSELALLTEWDLHETYPRLRSDLRAQQAGMYVADIVQRMTGERDAHPALFDALVECLRALDAGARARPLAAFQWKLLDECGYRPVLDRDTRTGEELKPAAWLGFAPELGGLVGGDDERAWRVRPGTVELLRSMADDGTKLEGASEEDYERAGRLLAAYVRHLLGHTPPTLELVYPELGPGRDGRANKG